MNTTNGAFIGTESDFAGLPSAWQRGVTPTGMGELTYRLEKSLLRYPVTFATHPIPTVHEETESGVLIRDHIFFLDDEMDLESAWDVLMGLESHRGLYLGLEESYVEGDFTKVELHASQFSGAHLVAWLNLFWDWPSQPPDFARKPNRFPAAEWVSGFWFIDRLRPQTLDIKFQEV